MCQELYSYILAPISVMLWAAATYVVFRVVRAMYFGIID